MKEKFLTTIIERFYPATSKNVQQLMASNKLLEKLSAQVYSKLETTVQKYADIADRIKNSTRLLDAWRLKKYKGVSYYTIFITVAVLLYFLSPIDLFPDFIPVIGGLDDLLLLNYLLKTIDAEIENFLEWENLQTT